MRCTGAVLCCVVPRRARPARAVPCHRRACPGPLTSATHALLTQDIWRVCERILKLSLPTCYAWLAMFYALFDVWLGIVAECTRFGDREFYKVRACSAALGRVPSGPAPPCVPWPGPAGAPLAGAGLGQSWGLRASCGVWPTAWHAVLPALCRTGGMRRLWGSTGGCGTCLCTSGCCGTSTSPSSAIVCPSSWQVSSQLARAPAALPSGGLG
jgi:hypothetical protein